MPETWTYARVFDQILPKDEAEAAGKQIEHPMRLLQSRFKIPDNLKKALEKSVRSKVKKIQAANKISDDAMSMVWLHLDIEKEAK